MAQVVPVLLLHHLLQSSTLLIENKLVKNCFTTIFETPYFYKRFSHFIIGSGKDPSQLTLTCSKSTLETLEKGVKHAQSKQSIHRRSSSVFIDNFEDISHLFLVLLLLNLNK